MQKTNTCQKAVGNKTDYNDGTGLKPVNKTELKLNTTKTRKGRSMVHIQVEESLDVSCLHKTSPNKKTSNSTQVKFVKPHPGHPNTE